MTYLDALQAVLAGEHAAVYAYGVVGARLHGQPDERAASAAYDAHRARRAAVTALVTAAGGQPTPAAVAYDIGAPVTAAALARALALRVERAVAGTYADLVGAAPAGSRATPAGWLADSAIRASQWSGVADAFPGLAERD